MSHEDPNTDRSSSDGAQGTGSDADSAGRTTEFDGWPVSGRNDEETEWIGVAGGGGGTSPTGQTAVLYDSESESVYEGEIDRENERIDPKPDTEQDASATDSIGEAIEDIGDRLGWESLSSFADEHLEDDTNETTEREPTEREPTERTDEGGDTRQGMIDARFQQKNVVPDADHQLEFFGSYTYPGEGEESHTVEREFYVYTDEADRTDGNPTAVVEEDHLVTSEEEQRTGGDADLVDEQRHELTIDIDSEGDTPDETTAIEEFCREWHEDRLDRR